MSGRPALRVGVLGTGNSGRFYHAEHNIARSADFELAVVAAGATSSARAAEQALGVPAVVGWDTVVARDDVDVVVVALPHHLHVEAGLAALRAGKHVLVDSHSPRPWPAVTS